MKKQFKENLNTAVLTSKYVISEGSIIVYITHHTDGVWEFWGNETISESEVMVISLDQMIKIDPTILEVSDLPIEFSAIRASKDHEWRIVPKN